ncbi:endonuclease/exonuclease/phosphatase family protein [Capnocytophaga sp.]|uniref:endonuclease/exonuclease/phosphatase family protein n=1 Tax=Capnocytophaga sp. TaxID=44737 RepID=UPI0026DB7533|nr:endonuclease/exonuclease/phosphatase family protein [Capnocytophaga sp.]MDO5105762.1 endonuclease/exonuclease/phosphatase family protein [Capnocytophaga sp.]
MKHIILTFALFYGLCAYSQAFKVMTFNIRLDNKEDKENSWTDGNRKERLRQLLDDEKPAILGVQEALHHQMRYLETHFPQYERVGVGRDDGKEAGEYVALYFDKVLFKRIDSGHFWLSQTPDIPSKGWDGKCCNRITTWVKLQYKNKKFFVFNTHFDHEGIVAQKESAVLILKKIKELTKDENAEVIVMGDFNITPDNEGIKTIKKTLTDTYTAYEGIPSGTFTAFKLEQEPEGRIDFIFISKGLKSVSYHIIDRKIDGLYPSDHFPVSTLIDFN